MTPSPITTDERQAVQRIADSLQWGQVEMAVGVLRRHVETLQRVERERVASDFLSSYVATKPDL